MRDMYFISHITGFRVEKQYLCQSVKHFYSLQALLQSFGFHHHPLVIFSQDDNSYSKSIMNHYICTFFCRCGWTTLNLI